MTAMDISEIEHRISINEMSAIEVFAQMKRHINNEGIKTEKGCAKFILEFEDTKQGGMKVKIELAGFNNATHKNIEGQTCVQNLYFAINGFLSKELGIKIPEVNEP